MVRKEITDLSRLDPANVDAPLLLLGLLYREVCRAMEVEPGDETAPAHLISSPLGKKELDQIERVLNGL
jgi:hypothetical protein